jgi:hypothetical protein
MNIYSRTATLAAAMALSVAPAFAAGAPSGTPDQSTNPGSAHRLAAPGQYCKAESKTPVAGQKGSPFSLCVAAQAKLRSGSTVSPRNACKAESKRHLAGQHGTPFSQCVAAGAKLLKDQQAQTDQQNDSSDQSSTTTS